MNILEEFIQIIFQYNGKNIQSIDLKWVMGVKLPYPTVLGWMLLMIYFLY